MRKINKIIVHWSASPKGTTVKDIRRWHMEENGWNDIGYHKIILYPYFSETSSETSWGMLVKLGRPDDMIGAHCKGNNTGSMGVCVVGNKNYSIHPLQVEALKHTIDILSERKKKKKENIFGHREMEGHSPNECPGKEILEIVRKIRENG